jgi:hypothetical protein
MGNQGATLIGHFCINKEAAPVTRITTTTTKKTVGREQRAVYCQTKSTP